MESLIQRANNSSYLGGTDKKTHWRYDWHVASRPEVVSGSHGNTSGEGGRAEADNNKTAFRFKTWLKSETPSSDVTNTISKEDLFDLTAYSTNPTTGSAGDPTRATGEGARNNSLTVEDIRGAVGNSESMIALSSAGTSAPKVGEKDEAGASKDENKPEAVKSIQASDDGTPVADATETKDAEGDVTMK